MADAKISALPAVTTPLDLTEVLPSVQMQAGAAVHTEEVVAAYKAMLEKRV